MATITPINPLNKIKSHPPAVEPMKKVSSWFMDEKLELNFGEYVGRPSENIVLHKEYLTRFLENGWTVDAVLSVEEGGKWMQVTKQNETGSSTKASSQSGTSSEQETKESKSLSEIHNREASSVSSNSSSSSTKTGESSSAAHDGRSYTNTRNTESSGGSGTTNTQIDKLESRQSEEQGVTSTVAKNGSTANESGNTDSATTSEAEGAAYWYAYQRIRLKRRRMQPERVLGTMIDSFTNEYNSGRKIDNDRFDEIVSVYTVLLNRTESEANNLVDNSINMFPLFNKVRWSIEDSLAKADGAATYMGTSIEQSAVDDINRRFDALKSEQMANMISNGMFNNTVWASVDAGIERQRAAALVKAKADSSQAVISAHTGIVQSKGSVGSSLLGLLQQMSDAADRRKTTATEVRNTVTKWMLDFIGAREEVYPTLEEVSMVAQQLGFSVGAAGNVL